MRFLMITVRAAPNGSRERGRAKYDELTHFAAIRC